MSERQGIEIDYCPQCRGVWLDRGELDKIIERSSGDNARPAPAMQQSYRPDRPPPQPYDGHRGHGYPKRRKSFLEELFD
jgi:Zn-finger nucleic acid-binding protein